MTVLIAHHNSAERKRIAKLLGAAGDTPIQCDEPKALRELIASARPEMILLDVRLAETDVLELTRWIKSSTAILVVHMTPPMPNEVNDDLEQSHLRSDGADATIEYPIRDREFLQWMRCFRRLRQSDAAVQDGSTQLSALIAAQHEIASAGSAPDTIMRFVAIQAQKLTKADGATVEMVEGNEMVCRAASGVATPQLGSRIKIAQNLSGLCVQLEEALRCDDVETDARANREAYRAIGARSVAVAPLHQYNSLGVLKVVSTRPHFFGGMAIELLDLVIHFMAAAINQAVASDAKQSLLAEHTRTIVALRESEERFRNAFDYAAIGMGLVALDGRWIKVNHTLCQIVGYTEAELRSRTFLELMHGEDWPHHSGYVKRLLAAEIGSFQMEARYFHRSGSTVWILLSVSVLRDGQEKPLYYNAQIQDITERKLAEETQARLTAILEATTDFVGTVDLDGRTLYLNRAFRELVGVKAKENVGEKYIAQYHSGWAAELLSREGFPAAVREGVWRGETALLSHRGQEIPTSEVVIAHKNLGGNISYFSTVARDITEQKRTEEALIMQARVLQNMSEGVCLLDEAGSIVYTNAAQERIFGYTPDELRGQSITKLHGYPPEENARMTTGILDHVRTQGLWSGEVKTLTKKGQPFTTATSISLLEISGRRYFVCVQEDITEKKRADEQIKNSLREKEVLLKEIHHRVKNNLQVISSLLNLQSGYIQDARTQDLFLESQNRVRSMALIHEKLYQSPDVARIDFSEYVFSLVSMLFRSYGTNSGAVKLDLQIAALSLNIDTAIPVGLLLNELVSNSLKYAFPSGQAGTISIDFRSNKPDEYALVFRDDGIGMPKDFDFEKSPSLGLRLVKILTHQIGGELLFSRSRGTEFIITFKEQKEKERN
jgi:PAS domain S-box-containing protein